MGRAGRAMSVMPRVEAVLRKAAGVVDGRQRSSALGNLHYDTATFETLRTIRDWKPDDVIMDVGANDGRTILRWRHHLPPTRVYGFEPVAETFSKLRERTAHLPDVHLFQCALGAEQQRRDIYVDSSPALASFAAGRTDGLRAETVEIDTVDAVLQRHGHERVHLLKIDTEGFDLEVLKGARSALDRAAIELIQVEAGFGVPGTEMPGLGDFQTFLAPHGYYLHSISNQCRARLGRYNRTGRGGATTGPDVLVYCDALFVSSG